MGMWLTFEPVLAHAGQYAKKFATARHGYRPAADSRAWVRYALAPYLHCLVIIASFKPQCGAHAFVGGDEIVVEFAIGVDIRGVVLTAARRAEPPTG